MIIRELRNDSIAWGRRISARVEWETIDRKPDELRFEVEGSEAISQGEGNPFLVACFPLAVLHGERRIRVDGEVCPMLADGLQTVAAWWKEWGLLRNGWPSVEAASMAPPRTAGEARGPATGFLSGGVDSVHMMLRNRALHRDGAPASIRDAILVHGFDIGGKKDYGLEIGAFESATRHTRAIAHELGVRLVRVSTNLRHLPVTPRFWRRQQHGAALAAVGHVATARPGYLFAASTYDVRGLDVWGSHPLIDPNYSTQRLTVIHDGVRFSRLDKVRELADRDVVCAHLHVCSRNAPGVSNCGVCEKCIRTRLEFLVVGRTATEALGESQVPLQNVEAGVEIADAYEAMCYRDLVEPLRSRGCGELASALERKLAKFAGGQA